MKLLAKILQEKRSDLVRECVSAYEGGDLDRPCPAAALFEQGLEQLMRAIESGAHTSIDLFIEGVMQQVARKELPPSRAMRVVNILRASIVESLSGARTGARAKKAVTWLEDQFSRASQKLMEGIEEILAREYAEHEKWERHAKELEGKTIKLTSKLGRGWVDVGGTRMCLLDILGGWSNMRDATSIFAGEETYHRVMFEMGLSETFSKKGTEEQVLETSAQGLFDAVDTFSEAGFGDFEVKELDFAQGYARITCKDTFEGWSFLNQGNLAPEPICYYSCGVLLSFMKSVTGRDELCATETSCIAKGDAVCEFFIGPEEVLARQGVPVRAWGMTIREKAEQLEFQLAEKDRVEKELTRKYREMSVLNRISARINQSLELDEILHFAISELEHIVGEDKGISIYLLDSKRNELVFCAQRGYPEEFFRRLGRLKLDEGMVGTVVREGIPLAYDNYPQYSLALKPVVEEAQVKSVMVVPLVAQDRIVGTLSVATRMPYHFTPEELGLMSLIGNQIGVAIEKARLIEGIRASEEKYKTLVEDINDGYVVCQDGRVVFANDAFLAMYGYAREEVLGCGCQSFFAQGWNEQDGPVHFEFLRIHRDGSKLPTEIKVSFTEFEGSPAMIGITRDISERKRMEQRVRESERLASIGQLAAAIAHEIRNPLSAIKMNVQILEKNLALEGFNKRRLEIAAGEINRLDRVVEDVLDFARPLQVKAAPGNLNDIVSRCTTLFRDVFEQKHAKVVTVLPGTLKKARIDGERIEQALLNIILNALDAMPEGGVLTITTRELDHLGRRMVAVEFRDSGVGMDHQQLRRIFDPFYTTKTAGVGLGLPTVKKIIEAHEGMIEVESAPQQGSTFRVLLPAER
jgi:PAS domain S-box-containing protein